MLRGTIKLRVSMLWLLMTLTSVITMIPETLSAAPTTSTKKIKSTKKKTSTVSPSTPSQDPLATSTSTGKSKYQLLGNVGMSPSPYIGFGGTLGLVRPSGNILEGNMMYATGKADTVAVQIISVEGRFRKMFGKYLYGAGGAGLRMAKGAWFVLNTTQDAEYPASASFNAITLNGAVGGQTKFGKFVVGIDAVGISFPLFKMGNTVTNPVEEDYDQADADAQLAKFNKAAGGMLLTIAKLGVGLEF